MNKLMLHIRKSVWLVKNTGSDGFSLLEISIVLAIMAIVSITGVRVLNGRMEQNIVDRIAADLVIVAEAAYECYIYKPDEETSTTRCKDNDGWRVKPQFGKAEAYLTSDNGPVFLPQNFSDNYEIKVADKLELVIRVNLQNKRLAQRVAGSFGSLAQAKPDNVVEVTLGIPGTENALAEAVKRTKREMKMEDFTFTSIGRNIEGVDYVVAQRIKLGGIKADGQSGVELTQEHVKALRSIVEAECGTSPAVLQKTSGNSYSCPPDIKGVNHMITSSIKTGRIETDSIDTDSIETGSIETGSIKFRWQGAEYELTDRYMQALIQLINANCSATGPNEEWNCR